MAAVADLSIEQLDHLHDAESNSIGALLAHMTTGERIYQIVTFEERELSAEEEARFAAGLSLGAGARAAYRGFTLSHYLEEMAEVRGVALPDDVEGELPT
ncbi:MAG: hypothetical protein ABIT20_26310 [Gemmatimonadaceae bacterium]